MQNIFISNFMSAFILKLHFVNLYENNLSVLHILFKFTTEKINWGGVPKYVMKVNFYKG